MKAWIAAARLRTLPLALAATGMGSVLAWKYYYHWSLAICLLTALTTILLQVLSNFANDYGDSVHGADKAEAGRTGPSRAVQSGAITPAEMKKAVVITAILSFIIGCALLYIALGTNWEKWFYFLLLGVASILAAIGYTMGKKPYGYLGLGDAFVFLFFGLVGVGGSFCLYLDNLTVVLLHKRELLAGIVFIGSMSVQVLNLNNMRDHESDRKAGKMTLALRLGARGSALYHIVLIVAAVVSFLYNKGLSGLIVALPLLVVETLVLVAAIKAVLSNTYLVKDKFLPMTAMVTALTVALLVGFWIFVIHNM